MPPFSFCNQGESLQGVSLPTTAEWLEVAKCNPRISYHKWGWILWRGWDHSQRKQDWWTSPPPLPLPSPDHRFESDRSSVSTSSSVSSRSNRSEGSIHLKPWLTMQQGVWRPYENQPAVFKHEDTKDAVTYQSSQWDLMVYHCAGSWDCTLLPYAIGSLLGYLRCWSEVWGHHPGWHTHHSGRPLQQCQCFRCFEPGAVSVANGWERDNVRLGGTPIEASSNSGSIVPGCFLPDHIIMLKHDCFYRGLPKWFKLMAACLKASAGEQRYSDYLCTAWEAEKEEAMELSHSQTVDSTSKPAVMSIFPLWKLKGTQPT